MTSDFMTAADCERFLSHLEVLSDEECWNWKGTILQAGYGQVKIGGKKHRAHRVAYRWHYGEIPEELNVLHLCIGNRRCCNPLHLYVGTDKDNQEQCRQEGRKTRGEALHLSRLTEDQVREVRRLRREGRTLQSIGNLYGVTKQAIAAIIKMKSWAWLPEDP